MTAFILLDHKKNHDPGYWRTECREVNGQWFCWAQGRGRWERAEIMND